MRSSFVSRSIITSSLALCLMAVAPAGAEMVLSDLTMDLDFGSDRDDLEVWNSGDESLFIEVEVNEIIDPHSESPQRRKLEGLRDAGLIVTPTRMVLQPNERRMLRVSVRKPAAEEDLVYRVSLVPRANPVTSGQQLALQVLVGYDVLVIVRPENPEPQLRIERHGRDLQIANDGNSSVLVRKLTQCTVGDDACVDLPGNRVYAGEAWSVRLPTDAPVDVHQTIGPLDRVESY